MFWCSSKIVLYYSPVELLLLLILFLFSLLLALLLLLVLLLWLKVWPLDVLSLKISVVSPSWIVYAGVKVVLPLIIIDIVRLLSLLEDKTTRLIRITFMPPPQKSQEELVWMELAVVVPNRFVITGNCAWIDNSVYRSCTPVIFFVVSLDDWH